jgi:CDP-diacylglycerol--serine O-phosphatidyltransferase
VVCGAVRLARFPLVKNGKHFLGLPIPPAGVALAGLAVAEPSALAALAAVVSLGALMVSSIPFPTLSAFFSPKERERSPREE